MTIAPSIRCTSPALVVLFVLAACGAETETNPGEEQQCPRGQVLEDGECVRSGNGGGGGGRTDSGDDGDDETDAGDPTDPDTGGRLCNPGETRCADSVNLERCNEAGDGYVAEPCEAGRTCSAGACGIGSGDCTPGETLGCASPSAESRCAANGLDFEIVACPADAPYCNTDQCTDQLCAPGARSCNGNDVVECDSSGQVRNVVQTCEDTCDGGRCVDPCETGGKTYVGCAFWAVDLDQYGVPCSNPADCGFELTCLPSGYCSNTARDTPFAVSVSNSSNSPVNVIAYGGDGTELARTTVPALNLASLALPSATIDDTSLTFESVRIEADGPVTMHQFNPSTNVGAFSNDASLLLPATAVGTEYIVNGYAGIGVAAPAVSPGKPYIAIIAVAEGETSVAVTTTAATLASRDGSIAAMSAGENRSFTLQRGQVLTLSGVSAVGTDFTGTIISGSQPISVFSGTECSGVPVGVAFCDHLEEQLTSVDTWGVEFVAAGFKRRGTEDTVWRIVASQNDTRIRTVPVIAGVNNERLQRGEFLEFRTTQDFFIGGSAPISVASFMVGSSYPRPGGTCDRNSLFGGGACAIPATCDSGSGIGDPAFMLTVPNEQFRTDYIVLTPDEYRQDYLTIVAPVGATITIDGSPAPAPDTAVGGYNIIRALVADGVHRVQGSQEFGLYAYGYDCDVSYAYPGGLNLESLAP